MDENFQEVRADLRRQRKENSAEFAALRTETTALQKEFAEVREAIGEQRAEAKGQIAKIDTRIDGLTRAMQIWCWLIVSFLVGLMGMFAAQL